MSELEKNTITKEQTDYPGISYVADCSICGHRKNFSNKILVSIHVHIQNLYCPSCKTRTAFTLIYPKEAA